tara:strand:+ start:329 stop:568 length:240 start_codon:yes stop_codon:yes gene_type:complete
MIKNIANALMFPTNPVPSKKDILKSKFSLHEKINIRNFSNEILTIREETIKLRIALIECNNKKNKLNIKFNLTLSTIKN